MAGRSEDRSAAQIRQPRLLLQPCAPVLQLSKDTVYANDYFRTGFVDTMILRNLTQDTLTVDSYYVSVDKQFPVRLCFHKETSGAGASCAFKLHEDDGAMKLLALVNEIEYL